MHSKLVQILIAMTVVFGVSCTRKGEDKPTSKDYSTEVVRALPDDQVILEYDGGRVTVGEVKDQVRPEFEKAREAILKTYIRAAEDVVLKREESPSANIEVTKAEAEQYIKANKVTQSSVEDIRKFLAQEKRRVQAQVAKTDIFRKLNVQNKLGAARYDLSKTKSMPAIGDENAKVTVQIFCDLMSPLCVRSRMFMKQIETSNPGKARFVYRFFPIPSHAHSKEAALIGICAHEQGIFWKVHDSILEQQRGMTPEKMQQLAVAAGADASDLKSCLTSTEAAATLEKDQAEATSFGLNQAPTYFVNGTKVTDPEQAFEFTLAEIKANP